MVKNVILLTCVLTILTGCIISGEQRLYEVRMMSGERLYAKSRPQLDDDNYYRFEDVNGQVYIIRESLVLFIEATDFVK